MSKNITTQKGYDLFEVVSSLQKEIRRGKIKEAFFWAYELHISGFHQYLWKRLITISMEDIGAANPDIIPQVKACKENYYENDKALLALSCAVVFMCRSPKSRLTDWLVCRELKTHPVTNLKIPDYALDKHTKRGKMKGRGFEHFLNEGSKLEPHLVQPDEEALREEVAALYTGDDPIPVDEGKADQIQITEEQQTLPLETPSTSARRRKAAPAEGRKLVF
jgi:hypothetical protein